MTNEVSYTLEPRHQMRINKIKMDPERAEDFLKLIERAYQENPDKKDLQALRQFLMEYPELCKAVFSLADYARQVMIKKMIDNPAAELAMEEQTIHLRNEFGYHDAPVMEQLIIENIILAWLRLYWIEYQLTLFMGRQIRFAEIEYWERRLSMAQRRYLSACESLAKIRRMAIPALQLNIGDKQVNVAGNLQAGRRASE